MKTEQLKIGGVPAVIYGESSPKAYLFVHGRLGKKEEGEAFAEIACPAGYQVLAADLPEHGERQEMKNAFNPWTAAPEIKDIFGYMKTRWSDLSLRACSIGAYFSMLALEEEPVTRALLLSPIVDMEELILRMTAWAGVTEDTLREKKIIETDFGESLSWSYLCWVRAHPVKPLRCPTAILYGLGDNLTPRDTIARFSKENRAALTVMESGEHWFHTPEQCVVLQKWEREAVSLPDTKRLLSLLTSKNSSEGCGAMAELVRLSEKSSACSPYLDDFAKLLNHKNSLVRNRGMALLAANARWDEDGKTDKILPDILTHITDEKPISARQCIKALREIAEAKPQLSAQIAEALRGADASRYPDSMRPLVERDIALALKELEKDCK